MKYDSGKTKPRKTRETRALLGSRFKILLADAGLSPESAGQLLHVTPRTIRYWLSGTVAVPYAAYKLVRVMRLFELPCEGWQGWHMHSGKLWTPEGYGFTPDCQNWWSLLVRQARLFRQMAEREHQLDMAMHRTVNVPVSQTPSVAATKSEPRTALDAPTGNAGRAAKPAGLDLSCKYFRTHIDQNPVNMRLPAGLENPQFVTNRGIQS
jgi:hypothetical protein